MAPRGKQAQPVLPDKTLVVDNGAYTIKAGFASTGEPNVEAGCHVIPNCLAKSRHGKVYVGSQIEQCTDYGEMAFWRPLQKGHLVSWEAEKEIWEQSFFDKNAQLKCDPHETNLLLAEASNGLTTLQTNCDQMVFEEFEFAGYRRCTAPTLNAYNPIASLFHDPAPKSSPGAVPVECLLVIDTGYSFTTITPMYNGRAIQSAIRRLDIGGKFLTNYLKDALSIRQMDVRDEGHMVDLMKQDACFVSENFPKDMESVRSAPPTAPNSLVVDYVMPDYTTRLRGEVRPHDPKAKKMMSRNGSVQNADGVQEFVLTLGNERFTVPEFLFTPTDVGLKQTGVAEMVMECLKKIPTGLWGAMLANVLIVGGSAKFKGFDQRLYKELRMLAPAECLVRIATAPDPIKSTWQGGAILASNRESLKEIMVTRQDYLEHGSNWLLRKFAGEKIEKEKGK